MIRFLIAFCAVCVFSIASVGVAQAGGANNGGGNDNGAGGGKGGGKKGSIEITNDSEDEITVFFRAEEDDLPGTLGEVNSEFTRVDVAPGETETISKLKEGNFDLVAATTAVVDFQLESDGGLIELPAKGTDGFSTVVAVMNGTTTEVAVDLADDIGDSFTGVVFSDADPIENGELENGELENGELENDEFGP